MYFYKSVATFRTKASSANKIECNRNLHLQYISRLIVICSVIFFSAIKVGVGNWNPQKPKVKNPKTNFRILATSDFDIPMSRPPYIKNVFFSSMEKSIILLAFRNSEMKVFCILPRKIRMFVSSLARVTEQVPTGAHQKPFVVRHYFTNFFPLLKWTGNIIREGHFGTLLGLAWTRLWPGLDSQRAWAGQDSPGAIV